MHAKSFHNKIIGIALGGDVWRVTGVVDHVVGDRRRFRTKGLFSVSNHFTEFQHQLVQQSFRSEPSSISDHVIYNPHHPPDVPTKRYSDYFAVEALRVHSVLENV